MGRAPCCEKVGLKKGRWTAEEDEILLNYIRVNGEGCWRSLPKNAGLLRCGKSCRLRWINYLRSDLKRGNITKEEEEIIIKMHASLGNRWSLIASHLSGRTDNEIKNYWNSHLSRKIDTFIPRLRRQSSWTQGNKPVISELKNPPPTTERRKKKEKKYPSSENATGSHESQSNMIMNDVEAAEDSVDRDTDSLLNSREVGVGECFDDILVFNVHDLGDVLNESHDEDDDNVGSSATHPSLKEMDWETLNSNGEYWLPNSPMVWDFANWNISTHEQQLCRWDWLGEGEKERWDLEKEEERHDEVIYS